MVSKVTAIALVAIIAVPILVGYGLNFNTGTETVYEPAGDVTNVTQLVQNSTEYNYVSSDLLALNSDNIYFDRYNYTAIGDVHNTWSIGNPMIPAYQSFGSSYSGLYYYSSTYTNTAPPSINLATIDKLWITVDNQNLPLTNSTGFNVTITHDNNTSATIQKVVEVYYDKTADLNKLSYTYLQTPELHTGGVSDASSLSFSLGANYAGTVYVQWRNTTDTAQSISTAGRYVNLTDGFRLYPPLHRFAPGTEVTPTILRPVLYTPTAAQKVLLTIDLDSITDSEYTWYIEPSTARISTTFPMAGERIVLHKTTDSSVHWTFSRYAEALYGTNDPSYSEELLYVPGGPNVYQLELTPNKATMFYVGGWPNVMGYANSFRSWSADTEIGGDIVKLAFTSYNSTNYVESPIMRVDYAKVRATETKTTVDLTFAPTNIKPVNPITTMDNIAKYGTSIDFGGINYPVHNGDITLGTHPISLNGATFSTIQNTAGMYDNKINGYLVSTTAAPATITFNGVWAFNMNTQSMNSSIVEINEWSPGGFAFADGVGFDFYLIGLLTSIAAFIFLAMYGRRSGAKVGGLMIVCGGAAFMFILLI